MASQNNRTWGTYTRGVQDIILGDLVPFFQNELILKTHGCRAKHIEFRDSVVLVNVWYIFDPIVFTIWGNSIFMHLNNVTVVYCLNCLLPYLPLR